MKIMAENESKALNEKLREAYNEKNALNEKLKEAENEMET